MRTALLPAFIAHCLSCLSSVARRRFGLLRLEVMLDVWVRIAKAVLEDWPCAWLGGYFALEPAPLGFHFSCSQLSLLLFTCWEAMFMEIINLYS